MISHLYSTDTASQTAVLQAKNVSVYYGSTLALRNVSLDVPKNQITALIGPSGSGKSTLLRCFNRTNELIPGARLDGEIKLNGQNLYAPALAAIAVRRKVGIVVQKPNLFPKSIYANLAYGLRIHGLSGGDEERIETALRKVWLWDEVKDKLRQNALSLSKGQQQRLCIARTIALEPELILLDEACSALDPATTMRIEDLLQQLKQEYSIVMATHNLKQASRASDWAAFLSTEETPQGRVGYLVEHAPTQTIFNDPSETLTRFYVSGHFS
ncbi:MAG: phosphate ABC transporter ATP-binding protein PstB [Elainellaceae cyanobacterium]